ncbi:hypothetical protein [Streptomyces abikoensis]|uniref:hypothetical protein n=1 Tax=Streptomyces abikoensis TaxID=97398 RepID=UPI00167530CF|nr:hypothetical protein [Streptomyces abikoensis]GGP39120.1 hypothetical protein GCM10010214_10460 [Streptomyces abikoensis]
MPKWAMGCVRVVVLAVAVLGLAHAPSWVEDAYRDRAAYERASQCPAGRPAGADCFEQVKGEVVGMATRGCPGDGCPPQEQRLHVRYGSDTVWLTVNGGTYDAARRGTPADVRLWHGTVTRVTVRGHTTDFLPSAGSSLLWRLAGVWLLAGVAICALIASHRRTLAFLGGAWLLLTAPFVVIVDTSLVGELGVVDVILALVLAVPGVIVGVVGSRRSARRRDAHS